MFAWFQAQLIDIIGVLVILGCFFAAAIAGVRASSNSKVLGWVVGVIVFVFLVALTVPLKDALDNKACELSAGSCGD